MPELNKEYASNSYNLLKDAYGDDVKLSENEFYEKLNNDKDGSYRSNVYNLLKDNYGEEIENKVSSQEFNKKFFVSDYQQELLGEEEELKKTQEQISLIETGKKAELPPKEWLEEQKDIFGIQAQTEESLSEKYWKEQQEILTQKKKRTEQSIDIEDQVFQLESLERQAIEEDTYESLKEEGYSPDIINYIKKEKQFEEQKESINSVIQESTDPNYQLSLYNYANLKDDLPEFNPGIDIMVKESEFSQINNYDDRVEFLQKQADEYVEKHKGENRDDELRNNFYSTMAPYVLFDDDGSPSMFAIQNMSKILDDRISTQITSLTEELNKLGSEKTKDLQTGKYEHPKLKEKDLFTKEAILHSSKSHKNDDEMRVLGIQIKDLERTQDILSQTLRKPLSKGGFGTGIKDIDWVDQATLGLKSIEEAVDFLNINKKYSEGQELTPGEQSIVDAVGMMNYVEGKSEAGISHRIGQGVAQMPAYMVGFAIGSPLYSGTKKVAQKAVGKVIKKEVKEKALGKLGQWVAHKAIPGAIGTIPSTIANPSTSVIENTATRMTDVAQIAFSDEVDDIHAKFIEGTGSDFEESLRKGATEAYTENLFERSGTALMQGLGYPIKGLTGKLKGTKLYQKLLVGEYARLKGLSPKSLGFKNNVTKVLETVGFNGMVEEMFEEYGTNIANGILNGEDMGFDLETFATTLGTVAVWGGALGTVNKASYQAFGKNIRATYSDVEGKKQSIKIPRDTYESMIELEKKDAVSKDDIQSLIKDGNLSGKQAGYVMKWWMSQTAKGIINAAQEEAKKDEKQVEEKPLKKEEEKKKKEEEKEVIVDDAVERNEFDDLSELESVPEDERLEGTQEKLEKTISDIKTKYHDDTALTDEVIDVDQLDKGANVTVQRKVGKERLNIPAEVIGISEDFTRIKYKNGVEDIITKEDPFKLFSNEKEKVDLDEDGKPREFLNKENEGKKGYIPLKLKKEDKFVYTKKIPTIEGVEGEFSMFRNENGTWDVIDQEGNIQEFEKPANTKVQKNVINAFKESKVDKKELSEKEIERKRKGAIENIKFIDADQASGNIVFESEFEGDKFQEVGDRNDIIDAINKKYDADLGKTKKIIQKKDEGSLFDELGGEEAISKLPEHREVSEKRKPTEKGQVIYATSGTGKTTLAKEQPEKYVDADVLIADEIKKMAKEGDYDTLPVEIQDVIRKLDPNSKTFSEDIGKIYDAEYAQGKTFANTTTKEAYDNVRKGFKAITETGKSILTGSSTFLDVADQVFTEEEKIVSKRKGKDLKVAKEREAERIKKFKREAIPLKERELKKAIEELEKEEVPKKKKIDFKKAEKQQESKLESFAKLRIKNAEKRRDEKKGTLQSGIPFVDENTEILFWRGVEKFAQGVKSLQELLSKIKKWIAETTDYSQEELDKIFNQMDSLVESRDSVIQQFKDLFESEKPFYEASESVSMTIEEKVNAHRKAFSSIFKNVADRTNQDKRNLEKKFYEIVQQGLFNELKNESDYKKAIDKSKKEYPGYEEMFNEIDLHWDYNRAVSLFNFYRSIRLIEQHGFVFTKDGVKFKSLNSEDYTNDLSNAFKKHIDNISFRKSNDELVDDPDKAIREILNDYRNNISNIKRKSNSESKIELFEEQLNFLQNLTGIDKGLWENYFTPITNETTVYLKKEDEDGNSKYEKVVFKDYRSLLNYDPNILNNGNYNDAGIISGDKLEGRYVDNAAYYAPEKIKKAPAILNTLTKTIDQSTIKSVRKNTFDFFTKGQEEKGVYSNIKKLASTVTKSGGISIDGIDVEGNRFNSFVLMSHLQNAADNLHKSNIDNSVAKMYKKDNIPMQIAMVNGIANNKNSKQSKSDKMTESEYWLTQLLMFQNPLEGKYKGVLGQFGDKKTIYAADVKFYDKINMNEIKKEFHDLNQVREMFSNIMVDGIKAGIFTGMKKSDRLEFIDNFIYNFVKNTKDVFEIFHGSLEKDNYKNLTELVKRAGSTNSTGYRLDQSIEGGVGKKFRFVSAMDNISPDELGLSKEQFDGILFYSGEMGDKLSKSMGDLYNKRDEYDGPLSSVKALFSTQKNKKRGLTKTNWVNIDVITDAYKDMPNHYSHKIKEFIDKNNIDAFSFDSGTKKLEKGNHLVLFDKSGNILDIPSNEVEAQVINRNTSDIYIQQDLRHTSEAEKGKQSTQLMANILPLQHSPRMVNEMNEQVEKTLKTLEDKLSTLDNTQDKLDFLSEQLKTQDQEELSELIESGVTLHDAGYRGMMQSILSSYFAKKGLQKLSNRVATQELPADKDLKGLRKTSDGKKALLAQVDTGIEGIRYDQKFDSQEKALKEYRNNKDKYTDLKEWEIEDGIIPGEIVLSTRVPADDLHSHTVARARHKLNGNFTVLDKESQARSGSDYDGDQRFNQILFRDKKGDVITKGVEGNANNFLLDLVDDYNNPENFERILHPIDTNFFDSIIPKKKIEYMFGDPQGLTDARKNNIVGVVMKGLLSDLSVMSALIANHNITPKKTIKLNKNLYTSQFAKDNDGSLRNAIGILQNLAFDNAKDPKLESLGLNEITANMFILLMITDPRIDTVENKEKFILNKVKTISDYFNSGMLQDFIKMKRESNGVLSDKKDKDIFKDLGEKHLSGEVDNLKELYYSSNDLGELKKYYALTKSFPNNAAELMQVLNTIDNFSKNNMQFLNVSELLNSDIKTFNMIEESVRFATNNIFNHTAEFSVSGQQVFKKIVTAKKSKLKLKRISLSNKEIDVISRSLNQIIAIDSVNDMVKWKDGKRMGLKEFEQTLYNKLPDYRSRHIGNKFLNALQRSGVKNNYTIKLADDYNFTKLPESELNEIRNDFAKLPEGLKNAFALYSMQKYGLGTSTFKGNFFNLFDLNYRVDLSNMISTEVERWQNGFIEEPKIDNVVEWISKMNEKVIGEYIKPPKVIGSFKDNYDVNMNPAYDLTNEALREISRVKSASELNEILDRENVKMEAFRQYFKKEQKARSEDYKVSQYAKDLLSRRENNLNLQKPVDIYNLVKKYKPCKFN